MFAILLAGLNLNASMVLYDATGLSSTAPFPEVLPATSSPAYIQAFPLARGPSVAASGLANSFSSNNWPLTNNSLADAIANDRYFQFSLAVTQPGVSLVALDARLRRSATSATFAAQWQYSLDGFSTAGVAIGDLTGDDIFPAGDGGPMPTIDLSAVSELQNLSSETVTFRLYVYGTPASTATSFAFGRSSLLDSAGGDYIGPALAVTAVPEPGFYGLVFGVVGFAWLMIRRRKRVQQ